MLTAYINHLLPNVMIILCVKSYYSCHFTPESPMSFKNHCCLFLCHTTAITNKNTIRSLCELEQEDKSAGGILKNNIHTTILLAFINVKPQWEKKTVKGHLGICWNRGHRSVYFIYLQNKCCDEESDMLL